MAVVNLRRPFEPATNFRTARDRSRMAMQCQDTLIEWLSRTVKCFQRTSRREIGVLQKLRCGIPTFGGERRRQRRPVDQAQSFLGLQPERSEFQFLQHC